MASFKSNKNKIKAKIEAIKRVNDDSDKSMDSLADKYLKDLPSTDKLFGNKLSDFAAKRKKKKENKKDVFSEMIDMVEGFLGTNKKVEGSEKEFSKARLKQHTNDATNLTIKNSKTIVMDSVKKVLFAGDGICGADKKLIDNIQISPKEFDFLNVLTLSPTSSSGKVMYEQTSPNNGYVKMNKKLYDTFTSSSTFQTRDGRDLFSMSWNQTTQKYTISNISTQNYNVENFLNDYYSNIEQIDFTGVTKTAMLMTLKGDGSEPPLFDKGFNDLNRLLNKLCALCNNPPKDSTLLQNALDQFNENDEDLDYYFDFDDVEGIDLDDESARYKKVLRFTDCNNFESPSNPSHFEDFILLSNKKNLNDLVNNALLNAASEAHEQSDSSIPLENFHISILNSFILNLPKALIASVLSPKYFLPIIIVYKSVVSGASGLVESAKELMRKLKKLFNEIIKNLLWKFLSEFWRLIKIDLLNFLQKLAIKIIKNKNKRYLLIIASLIAFLTTLLDTDFGDCDSLVKLINGAIDSALSGGNINVPVPAFLLTFASSGGGMSNDRAILNIAQRLEAAGVSTQPIFGEPNNLLGLVKSTINGFTDELDSHSYVQTGNLETVLPGPTGPVVVPRGLIKMTGKLF